ncbi:unnamed protein product [Trichogramma brassicae]|uniref:Retrotransposon gag domain-containing protein n=1 Tax=Trichogramma brassicae TaxID=86971 RepID=A0A6H5INX7_9HYME|nr:unnamed protein product [Trichogramma brassicae]
MLEILLEKSQERPAERPEKNMSKIAREFTIDNFTGKSTNAEQWMKSFEKECERFGVTEEENRIEVLKSFMEKGAADWYASALLKFTVNKGWEAWKKSFEDTFGGNNWSTTRYALTFKYQSGSILDYALKKEKLLLELRKSMDVETIIDLIAVGLPNFILDKIDKKNLRKTEDLFGEISPRSNNSSSSSSGSSEQRRFGTCDGMRARETESGAAADRQAHNRSRQISSSTQHVETQHSTKLSSSDMYNYNKKHRLTRRPSHLRVMDLVQTFSGDSGQLENMPCYVRLLIFQWWTINLRIYSQPSHLRVMDLAQTFSGDSGQLENKPCYVRLCSSADLPVHEQNPSQPSILHLKAKSVQSRKRKIFSNVYQALSRVTLSCFNFVEYQGLQGELFRSGSKIFTKLDQGSPDT